MAVASTLLDDTTTERLRAVLRQYWGYEDFLPHQQEAMKAVVQGRDSLVVLPTGGGKSLCYQVPALCQDGLAVVVSPLIALMKDQVDGLIECGIDAAAVNSTMSADERRETARRIRNGSLKLLYVSPERLLADKTMEFLQQQRVALIAIDEAHCISSWGHDFRPEYRELGRLRERFPGVSLHALTATATAVVREDICRLLGLIDPLVLVGSFQRPNLVYHVARRSGGVNQVCSVLDRNRGQSGIVYCISRADVDETSQRLNQLGYSTLPYHAGMPEVERRKNQDAFINDQVETIVATIAFGMGIDKSNVRYVIHAGMPRSLENYQQESGRAGRDGLNAECWLLYSPQDRLLWHRILAESPAESREAAERGLLAVSNYCTGVTCRHATLLQHFGQTLAETCASCDICLGTLQQISDPQVIGQKILSCVLRVGERFGAAYVAKVLAGSRAQRISDLHHDQLSTFGLLSDFRKSDLRDWIEQLVQQGFLCRSGEYQVLSVTPSGRELLKGAATPRLLKATTAKSASTPSSIVDSWEGVDRGLFDRLRQLRRARAEAARIPSYLVFSDATLRDIARRRPSTPERFLSVHGVGERKAKDYGPDFVNCVVDYCQQNHLQLDQVADNPTFAADRKSVRNEVALRAFELFRQGQSIPEVAAHLDRALSTTRGYLIEFIANDHIDDARHWVTEYDIERIELAADYSGGERLKPIHDAFHGKIDFDSIRITLACRKNRLTTDPGRWKGPIHPPSPPSCLTTDPGRWKGDLSATSAASHPVHSFSPPSCLTTDPGRWEGDCFAAGATPKPPSHHPAPSTSAPQRSSPAAPARAPAALTSVSRVPSPLYTPQCVTPAYQLRWSLAFFGTAPLPPPAEWQGQLQTAVERDAVRLLEVSERPSNTWLFLLSTQPHVPPTAIVRSVKGRLQHILHSSHPDVFQRNFSLTSVGDASRAAVEGYISSQVQHHQFADERLRERLSAFQLDFPEVDLSAPVFSTHGRYVCNLHLVFVNAERGSDVRESSLAATRDMFMAVAGREGHRVSRLSILPDHLHAAIGGDYLKSPGEIALLYMNNLAYAHGMTALFENSYYVGTFGEYDMRAVRQRL